MPIDYTSETLPQTTQRWLGGRGVGGAGGGAPPTVPTITSAPSATGGLPVNAIPGPTTVPQLGQLADQINRINRRAQTQANQARIPGAPGLEQQSSTLIGQELAGNVPQDVMRLLGQQGAEGAVGSGINPNAAYLRALGQTSLDQQQRGEANLSSAYARNPGAPIFDPTTQLLTPGQSGQLNLEGQRIQLAREAEANRVAQENARLQLEAQNMALRGGGGGGGGGGGVGGGGGYAGGSTGTYNPHEYSGPAYNWQGPIGPGNPAYPTGDITPLYGPGAAPGQDWSNPQGGGLSPQDELTQYLQGAAGLDAGGGDAGEG